MSGRRTITRLLVGAFLVAGCGIPDSVSPQDGGVTSDATWVGWPACDEGAETQTITFVHASDLHAHYTPDVPGESPASRIRGYYEAVRLESPYTLFTDAGDDYEKGSVAELLSDGAATREIVQAMAFDVRTLGNHDYAWNLEETLAFSHDEHALVLASNVGYLGSDPAEFAAVDYGELEVGCLRIGFFGMVSRPWNERNVQFDGDYYPELPVRHDVVERAAEIVDAHVGDADLVVMVSHLGLSGDIEVAEEVPGIDLVLGGHSHVTLDEPLRRGDDTLIVHPGAYGQSVARLDLEIHLPTTTIAEVRYALRANPPGGLPVSPAMQAAVEDVMARHAPYATDELCQVSAPRQIWEVAYLTAQAALHHLAADGAITDSATVWQEWEPGPLSQQALLDTFKVERQPAGSPGYNSFYLVDILGEDLIRLRLNLLPGWSYAGLDNPDPETTYLLALQKHAAFNPERYLSPEVAIGEPAPGAEAWEVLESFGAFRTEQCRYLDDDAQLPGC